MSSSFYPIFGTILIALGIYWLVYKMWHLNYDTKTTGIVISFDSRLGTSWQQQYHSKIQFTALDGRQYTFSDSASSTRPIHRIGEQVTVLYNPNQPTKAEISTLFRNVGIPILLFVFGALAWATPYLMTLR